MGGAHTNLYQLSTVIMLAGEQELPRRGMHVYLGEKVVSENEYLSAMVVYDAVLWSSKGVQDVKRGWTDVAGREMDVSSELV